MARSAHIYVVATKRDQPDTIIAHGPDLTGDRVDRRTKQPITGTFNRLWPALKGYDGVDPSEFAARFNDIANSIPKEDQELLPVLAQLKWACDVALDYRQRRQPSTAGGVSIGETYADLQIRFKVND